MIIPVYPKLNCTHMHREGGGGGARDTFWKVDNFVVTVQGQSETTSTVTWFTSLWCLSEFHLSVWCCHIVTHTDTSRQRGVAKETRENVDQLQVQEALQSGSQALFESRIGLYFSPPPTPTPRAGDSASSPPVVPKCSVQLTGGDNPGTKKKPKCECSRPARVKRPATGKLLSCRTCR